MLKLRTFSMLLLLCMGVPRRCLNLDVRTLVKAFLGLAGDSGAGSLAEVDWRMSDCCVVLVESCITGSID